MSSKPLAGLTIEELLARVAELDAMAATATTTEVKQSLERLAARFRGLAARRADEKAEQQPLDPTERAPQPGDYQQLNIFGTPTGQTVRVRGGEPLPPAPRGFTWRLKPGMDGPTG